VPSKPKQTSHCKTHINYARGSKSHRMSNAGNTKTKTQIAANKDRTRTKKKQTNTEKSMKTFLFQEKIMPARGWLIVCRLSFQVQLQVHIHIHIHSQLYARKMRPICSHRCNINVTPPFVAPPPSSPLQLVVMWPVLWSICACWPSKLSAKRQQP